MIFNVFNFWQIDHESSKNSESEGNQRVYNKDCCINCVVLLFVHCFLPWKWKNTQYIYGSRLDTILGLPSWRAFCSDRRRIHFGIAQVQDLSTFTLFQNEDIWSNAVLNYISYVHEKNQNWGTRVLMCQKSYQKTTQIETWGAHIEDPRS